MAYRHIGKTHRILHILTTCLAYMIGQKELMAPDPVFYETLARLYEKEWSQADMQLFITLYSQGGAYEAE